MTNLDSLTPEELNARAAEFMGWERKESPNNENYHGGTPHIYLEKELNFETMRGDILTSSRKHYLCGCQGYFNENVWYLPNYCQDMNTAMELVEKLNNLGFSVEIYIGPNKEAEIEINCLDGRFLISDDTLFFGRGETKTAITKVFILAMESTTNKKEK